MPPAKHITLKILLSLVFIESLETAVQFCFKKAAFPSHGMRIETLHDLFSFINNTVSSPFLWIGLFSVLIIFTIWSTILSKIDLSVAAPACSFSFLTVPLVSIVFLHEKISILRWIGMLVILIGVFLVSISSRQKEGLS